MRRKRTQRELEASIQSHKGRLTSLGTRRDKKSVQRRAYSTGRIREAEHELKTGKVPTPDTADHEYAVGQWSSWIGVAFGALAAIINRAYEPMHIQVRLGHCWDTQPTSRVD
ncbi:13728_t:CDS:2 [Acaulospora colombiana]|uniref:13728_t:CDS:1 n=1 Tax=Acaulospora colombiana TaxID=27376 RepID=A0ACA9Q6A3_9GLOM|nr:13728_t:CDS:2 [Acaulospora colombiana]